MASSSNSFSQAVGRVKSWLKRFGTQLESSDVNHGAGSSSSDDTQCLASPLSGTGPAEQQQPFTLSSTQQPQPAEQQAPARSTSQTQAEQQTQQQVLPAPGRPPAPPDNREFFTEYGEANRYLIREVIGKGSYGIVCSAVDQFTGERVAIKKITNVFEHVSDATRILREIKLLRLLKHPDIVEIKHIMLPPSARDFKDIYVVFELMETDLHQVIKANDDLTPDHHQFFLYQMLRGLKYIHSAKVFHRDLKPKNILANSDCKLKICDFGLARPAFNDVPTAILWTDYVATRWYRAPELCGSFFAKYSPAIDIWSVGCIFAEVLLGKPLFPGKNVAHQLEIITDLLGTPPPHVLDKVRNEKARRFLMSMRPKPGIPFQAFFPNAAPAALALLKRMLSFDPAERPTAEEALADPYFAGLHSPSREPVANPVSRMAFEFDRRKLEMNDVRQLIYQEILEYHPQVLRAHLGHGARSSYVNPSALDNFRRQFLHLEQNPGAVIDMRGSSVSGAAPGSAPSAQDPSLQQYHRAVAQQYTGGAAPAMVQQQPQQASNGHTHAAAGYTAMEAESVVQQAEREQQLQATRAAIDARLYAQQQQQQQQQAAQQAQAHAHYQQQMAAAAAAAHRGSTGAHAIYYPAQCHAVSHSSNGHAVQYVQYTTTASGAQQPAGARMVPQQPVQVQQHMTVTQQQQQQVLYAQAWAVQAQAAAVPVVMAPQQQAAAWGGYPDQADRTSAAAVITHRERTTSVSSSGTRHLQSQISAPMPAMPDDHFQYAVSQQQGVVHAAAPSVMNAHRNGSESHPSPMLIDESAGAGGHGGSASSQGSTVTSAMLTSGSSDSHMLVGMSQQQAAALRSQQHAHTRSGGSRDGHVQAHYQMLAAAAHRAMSEEYTSRGPALS